MSMYQASFLAFVFMVAIALGGAALAHAGNHDNQGSANERYLVQLSGPAQASDRALVRGLGGSVTHAYTLVPAMAVEMPEDALPGLARSPRVALIEPDVEVQALAVTPIDDITDEYGETWSIANINAGSVHDGGNTGAGVKVGVIDSGVSDHYDLTVSGGHDFVDNDADPSDVYGHGTHVAGTVCAAMNGGGAVGVAPDCDLYSLRVLNDDGVGYTSDIIAAVDWAAANDLDVINLSLGSSQDPGAIAQAAYDAAYYDHDVLIVAAAGNSGNPPGKGTNTIWPANYDSVIAVAATDKNNNRASFSSTGDNVELAAPGASVHSTWNDGTSPYDPQPNCIAGYDCYKDASGTSMASPQVAGVASLVLAAGASDANGNGRVNDDVRAILQQSADDLGAAGKDPQYGYGLVDAAAAVADLGPVDEVPTVELLYPGEGGTVAGDTTLFASADDDDAVVEVRFYVDDVLVGTDTTPVSGTTTYDVPWDSTTVSDGVHSFKAVAEDTAGQTASDAVSATVDNVNDAPNADAGPDQSALVGEEVSFDGSGSSDDRGIVSYAWDFGDGATSSEETASHAYAAAGTYTVTLTVTDTDNVSDSDSATVTVEEEPAGPTEAVVDAINYATDGGRNQDKHLSTTPLVVNDFGNPVSGATISIVLDHDGGSSWSASGTTDAAGMATFDLKNAPSGCYSTTVTDLSASGLTWDGTTPANSFCK